MYVQKSNQKLTNEPYCQFSANESQVWCAEVGDKAKGNHVGRRTLSKPSQTAN